MQGSAQIHQLLPEVISNWVPAQQEYRLSAITDTADLQIALAGNKLADIQEESLKECLRYVFMLIGIKSRNLPDDIEKVFLHQYIRRYYGGHTDAEVRLAFDMAIQHKLGVDPVCYENFSVAYFARIMEAYRDWARQQVKQIPTLPPVRTFSPEERLQLDLDYAWYKLSLINKLPARI